MGRTVLFVCAAVTLAACNKVDTKKLEKDLQSDLEAGGMEGVEVSCPKDVKAEEGKTFQCDVKMEDRTYKLDVTIKEKKGSELDLQTNFVDGAAFPRKKLVELLVPAVKEKIGQEPTIDCGEEPLLFAEEGKIYCKVSAGGQSGKLRVDIDGADVKGWEIEQ